MALYGTSTIPIPVPLYDGETFREYEQKFQKYLKTVSMDLSRLPYEPNTERSLRLLFVQKRLENGSNRATRQAEHGSKQQPSYSSRWEADASRSEATSDTALEESDTAITSGQSWADLSCTAKPDKKNECTEPSHSDTLTTFQFPARCSLDRTPTEAPVAELLSCGCRQCLLQSTSRLIAQVATLEATRASKSIATTGEKELMDLTKDADANSSAESSRIKGVDVARMLHITALVKERRQQWQNTQTAAIASVQDPIEHQLLAQYNEINARVITNQRALENATAQLQDAPLDLVGGASHFQCEIRDLQGLIEEEMGHRNAALAMLFVYMWRHDPQELEQRIQTPSAANIPHVQRMCHQKCVTAASEIASKKDEASDLTSQLEAVMSEPPPATYHPDSDMQRLTRLQELGAELTRVEGEARTLEASRRRELTTLLHFDAHVRQLVAAFLQEK